MSSLRGRASSFDSPDKASTVTGSTEVSRRDRSVSDADVVPKLKSSQVERNLGRLNEGLALPEGQPILMSSKTSLGRDEVWKAITEMCATDSTST